jgi:hypothetical protein
MTSKALTIVGFAVGLGALRVDGQTPAASGAKTELGDAFDIEVFHTAVPGGGALPMTRLERQVKSWVADANAAQAGR